MDKSVNPRFWKDKKVFITGHTGFKGSWLCIWLKHMGAEIKGFSLPPTTSQSLFQQACVADGMESEMGDIRDLQSLTESMLSFDPDILIHMAAQPLVQLSYVEPVSTYMTNVMGTVHVLEAARRCKSLKSIVNVTTDKCYENKEWIWGYRENEPMGGHDPYSNSKGCSELVTAAYRKSFFDSNETASVASARAGNVIGGGDWAEGRLIPDALKAFNARKPVMIRNPSATRPWQHVLEPLSGYLSLAERLYTTGDKYAEGWNFGPRDEDVVPVGDVLDYLVSNWHTSVSWETDSSEYPHEAQLLSLDISKARSRLNWQPLWSLSKALSSIIEWNSEFIKGSNMADITLSQIQEHQNFFWSILNE